MISQMILSLSFGLLSAARSVVTVSASGVIFELKSYQDACKNQMNE